MLSNTLYVLIVFAFRKAERMYLGKDRVIIGTPLSAFLVFQSTSTNQMAMFILRVYGYCINTDPQAYPLS